jgi:N-terminal domain of NWD NACHT-NTPase
LAANKHWPAPLPPHKLGVGTSGRSLFLLLPPSLINPTDHFLNIMTQKEIFRRIFKQKKKTDPQDGTVVASALPSATLSTSTAGSSATGGDSPQPAPTSPVPASMESRSPEQVASLSSGPPASSVQQPLVHPIAPTTSRAQATLSATADPTISSLPEQLWDKAYDGLKAGDERRLLQQYEVILSRELDDGSREAGKNLIEMDPAKRRPQMGRLLNKGLDKIEKLQKTEKIGDAISIVLSVKEAIAAGFQAVPTAALVWTGVCFVLPASPPSDISSAGSHHFVDSFEHCRLCDGESRRNCLHNF